MKWMEIKAGDSTVGALISGGNGVPGKRVGVDSTEGSVVSGVDDALQAVSNKERIKRKENTLFIRILRVKSNKTIFY